MPQISRRIRLRGLLREKPLDLQGFFLFFGTHLSLPRGTSVHHRCITRIRKKAASGPGNEDLGEVKPHGCAKIAIGPPPLSEAQKGGSLLGMDLSCLVVGPWPIDLTVAVAAGGAGTLMKGPAPSGADWAVTALRQKIPPLGAREVASGDSARSRLPGGGVDVPDDAAP
jgi:hypothetical protein